MSAKSATTTYSTNVLGLLGIAFVVLKLTGYIDWSWWWVTAPFWGGIAIAGVIILAALLVALVAAGCEKFSK